MVIQKREFETEDRILKKLLFVFVFSIISLALASCGAQLPQADADVAVTQTAVSDAEKTLGEAKTAADSGDFATAKVKLTAAKEGFVAQQNALEAVGYKK